MSTSMYFRLETRLRSAVPVLSFVCLAACNSTVEQPSQPLRGTQCVALCELQHPGGLQLYESVVSTCVCKRCSEDCRSSVCFDKQTPSDECLPCVQDALGGADCDEHGGLFGACFQDKPCADFVACVTACVPTPVE